MTNRCDAELAEILAGQPAQYLPINVIVAERGRISLEPEAAQPFGHNHRSCPGTASLSKHYTPDAAICPALREVLARTSQVATTQD
jgi:hypothetical protein